MKYYRSKTIKETTINAIRPKVEEELKKQGFGVLTEIDIQAIMKKKLDKDYLPHVILGACNPVYADKVLSIEPTISTMLPCNVTLRELGNGDVEIAMMAPAEAMSAVGNKELEIAANEVQEKLMIALNSI
ncbi:MAG: DUF302 domain-containing protein [Bacteroidetes bacterium]|nr:DUF302 domain-containing protein [Bacteroidota bacterium]MBP7398547.1 DUF302 domain-containing protein [Chitinophagales bacterium]MBK7109942.1 DUF302 domain-containing protein [Bacteroidota bacterium]MBK8682929.1 DUF302 domain-containing protein [Bacteroidota bacterium]MBP8755045.1 DUF302 domain-containing protein [Chitinophagales bacterium]